MISTELALALREAGLVWHPRSGDRFQLDEPEFEADVFTVSEMTIEPRDYPTGRAISGLDAAAALPDVKVFHAGTRRERGRWTTAGGRVLAVTARGATLAAAQTRAYEAVAAVRFDGAQWRRDIGARALGPARA